MFQLCVCFQLTCMFYYINGYWAVGTAEMLLSLRHFQWLMKTHESLFFIVVTNVPFSRNGPCTYCSLLWVSALYYWVSCWTTDCQTNNSIIINVNTKHAYCKPHSCQACMYLLGNVGCSFSSCVTSSLHLSQSVCVVKIPVIRSECMGCM